MAVTETSATAGASGGSASERLQQPLPRPSAQVSPASDPAVARAEVTKAEPTPTPSPIGFTLHFDGDSQRLILEAREPASGYLIVQIPPKYVVKQFSATVRAQVESRRGQGINDAV